MLYKKKTKNKQQPEQQYAGPATCFLSEIDETRINGAEQVSP